MTVGITSGEVLKYRNGFFIRRRYETPLAASSWFCLTVPSVHNHFNQENHLYSRKNLKLDRSTALAEWRELSAA